MPGGQTDAARKHARAWFKSFTILAHFYMDFEGWFLGFDLNQVSDFKMFMLIQ